MGRTGVNWKWLGLFKDWPCPWLASGGGGTSKDLETMSGEFWGRRIKTVRSELTRAYHFLMNSSLPVVFTSVSSFAILRSCQVRALEAVFGLYHHSPHLKNSCQFLRPRSFLQMWPPVYPAYPGPTSALTTFCLDCHNHPQVFLRGSPASCC